MDLKNNLTNLTDLIESLYEKNSDANFSSSEWNKRKQIFEEIVKSGIDLNTKDVKGRTPLHIVALNFNEDIMKLLLDNGADVRSKTKTGETPLHYAVETRNLEAARLLLTYGADATDQQGLSIYPEIAKVYVQQPKEHIQEENRNQHDRGIYVNANTKKNLYTALHSAVENKDIQMINLILKYKVDVNARTMKGWTPLHLLTNFKMKNSKLLDKEQFETCFKIISILLKSGSDIEAKDNLGRTPMTLACFYDDVNAVAAFLRQGGSINVKDNNGRITFCYIDFMSPDLREIVEMHIIKLGVINFCVELHFRDLRASLLDSKPDFVERCKEEIERMKSFKITKKLSLYDIIKTDEVKLNAFVENRALKKVMTSNDFEKKYPIYGYLLEIQYQKIDLKQGLLYAQDMLFRIFKLPHLCVDQIFKYISDEPLYNSVQPNKFFCKCTKSDYITHDMFTKCINSYDHNVRYLEFLQRKWTPS